MPHTRETPRPLASARVLIVGIGGLGTPCAMALAAAGVGRLGLIDPDRVAVSNLHRQLLFEDEDVGRPKPVVAAERLTAAYPGVRVDTWQRCFTPGDADLGREFDVLVDGTDTVEAKFTVNDAAVAAGVPLVHAGVNGFRAQLMTVLPGTSACYRCLFEEPPPPGEVPSCESAGVTGPVVALAGALQAAEALRLLGAEPALFADHLLVIDAATATWRRVPLARNPACAACGTGRGARSEPWGSGLAERSEAR